MIYNQLKPASEEERKKVKKEIVILNLDLLLCKSVYLEKLTIRTQTKKYCITHSGHVDSVRIRYTDYFHTNTKHPFTFTDQ